MSALGGPPLVLSLVVPAGLASQIRGAAKADGITVNRWLTVAARNELADRAAARAAQLLPAAKPTNSPQPSATVCSVDSCQRSTLARGLCAAHYERLRTTGNLRPVDPIGAPLGPRPRRAVKLCTVEGCDRPHSARGYCNAHYRRLRDYGDVRPDDPIMAMTPRPDACTVEGCGRVVRARGMCATHHQRVRVHGDPRAHIPVAETTRNLGRTCSEDGCDGQAVSLGLCQRHYNVGRRARQRPVPLRSGRETGSTPETTVETTVETPPAPPAGRRPETPAERPDPPTPPERRTEPAAPRAARQRPPTAPSRPKQHSTSRNGNGQAKPATTRGPGLAAMPSAPIATVEQLDHALNIPGGRSTLTALCSVCGELSADTYPTPLDAGSWVPAAIAMWRALHGGSCTGDIVAYWKPVAEAPVASRPWVREVRL